MFKFSQTYIIFYTEDSKSVLIFFSGFSNCWAINNVVTFHTIKDAKYIWDWGHQVAETGSRVILIVSNPSFEQPLFV